MMKSMMIEYMQKAKKLPRLLMIGLFPSFAGLFLNVPQVIQEILHFWAIFFIGYFWIEGLHFALKVLNLIEINGKTYNAIQHLYDMEDGDHNEKR